VDFDHSMNTAVNKLREALGDSAESPRFIETLPKRGYRFIAPVQPSAQSAAPRPRHRPAVVGVAAGLIVVLGLAAYVGWQRWGRRATPPEGRIMLAVLPFENLSGDPEQEYFSDGMTEEMISQLGQVHPERLGVIARTSAMQYKKTSKRVDEIGHELGVDYVVEGSVRRGNERIRVTAQLIQVSDQTKVWSESYESSVGDVLALQSEVARAIAGEIQLKLAPQQPAPRPVNPAAYEAYLKGVFHMRKLTTPEVKKGFDYFQQAIAIDPNYALAYTGLAACYGLGNFMGMRPSESRPKAKEAALKALELDDTLAEAHASLATVLMDEWDWAGADREFRRALELNAGIAHIHSGQAWLLAVTGRTVEAITEMTRARELDPLSVGTVTGLGRMFMFARRYDEAIEQFGKAQELDPNYIWAHFFRGIAYQQKGMHHEAVAEIQKAMALGDPEYKAIGEAMGRAYAVWLPCCFARHGRRLGETACRGYSQASA
jgi:TolB-like protein/Tfp pilus assembly protein PilF